MHSVAKELLAPTIVIGFLGTLIGLLYGSIDSRIAGLDETLVRTAADVRDSAATLSVRVDGIYTGLTTLSASVDQRLSAQVGNLSARIDVMKDQQIEFAAALARQTEQINALTVEINKLLARSDRSAVEPMGGYYESSPVSLALAKEASDAGSDALWSTTEPFGFEVDPGSLCASFTPCAPALP